MWISEGWITVDGRPLETERRIYLLLYKPKGFVTTAKDPDGRPTVYDLIRSGALYAAKIGHSIRVPRTALEQFLDGTTEPGGDVSSAG